MTNRHVQDLRMLASLNGARTDDRRILEDAANYIEQALGVLVMVEVMSDYPLLIKEAKEIAKLGRRKRR